MRFSIVGFLHKITPPGPNKGTLGRFDKKSQMSAGASAPSILHE